MNTPSSTLTVVHVAVAVIKRADQILIAKRPEDAHQGGLWEFPGGKVESEETVTSALKRELYEELGICIDLDCGTQPLIRIRHDYGDKAVLLDVWIVEYFSGEPRGAEGQLVRWVSRSELTDYKFPEANKPIIKAIALPREYLITGKFSSPEECLQRLRKATSPGKARMVQFRAHDLYKENRDGFLSVAGQALKQSRENQSIFVLNGPPELLDSVNADGVHLPFHLASQYHSRPVPNDKYLGVSCHNEEQLSHASRLRADYALLSPVVKTNSHPETLPLGWPEFEACVERVEFPVYALGGMVDRDLNQAIESGAQGIAAISAWW